MLSLFAVFFMAFRNNKTAPDLIQAKKFELVDDKGNVLIRLSENDGNGTMKTYRSDGKRLLNLTYTTKNEGYIGVEDGADHELIRFSSTTSADGGGGYISIYNPSGKRTMSLCNQYSGGNIYVCNSDGYTRAAIQNNSAAGGYLALNNSSGNIAIQLSQTSSGNGDLYINSNSGDERVRLSVSSSGGNVQLKNNSKTMVVEMGVTAGEHGIINTYNSGGTYIQGIGSSN